MDEDEARDVARSTGAERVLVRRLALGALACVAALGVLYLLAVQTRAGQQVEESVVRGAAEVLGDVPWSPTGRIERVSVLSVGLASGLVVALALVRRRPRLALLVAVVVVGSLVSVQLLKHVVLPRPGLVPTDYARGRASLPSGHTAVGMVLATVLVLVLPLRLRPCSWVVVGLFGATFGVSTVLSADHRPADVVAAHLVVLAWVLAGAAVLVAGRGRSDPADPPPTTVRVPLVVLVAVGTVAAVGAAVSALLVVVLDPARAAAMRAAFFGLAVLALSAEAALATSLLLVVFRAVSLDPPDRGGADGPAASDGERERVTGIEPA
ncbi:MAG: phosphatase PAP2 family protein [Actinomycetes bacterium]